ncbi:hypothetical protein [Pseudomonas sp. Pseusp97]|uniref:hypothetical protein n=1 Tax=Pseudomonas sp. Pseusp97 TaxID=3243065 RepID=UPI0039A61753
MGEQEKNEADFSQREYPVPERIESQRRAWKLERISLVLLVGIVLLALTGVFSSGPLSSAQMTSPGGNLEVAYERFERLGSSSRLHIILHGEPSQPAKLRLNGDLLAAHDLQSLQPPLPARSWNGGMELQGQLDERGELHLYLALLATQAGLLSHRLEFAGEQLSFRQFVYP